MTKIFLFFLCVFCIQDNEPVITWSSSYKLSWKNFKGSPQMDVTASASTSSGIRFGYSVTKTNRGKEVVSFTTEVFACFYPEKSWYKKKLATSRVLRHEQIHFNITELYARKFRHRISQIQVSNMIEKELKLLFKMNNKKLDMMQKKYDRETDHSINKDAQAQWELFINAELKKLSEYEL